MLCFNKREDHENFRFFHGSLFCLPFPLLLVCQITGTMRAAVSNQSECSGERCISIYKRFIKSINSLVLVETLWRGFFFFASLSFLAGRTTICCWAVPWCFPSWLMLLMPARLKEGISWYRGEKYPHILSVLSYFEVLLKCINCW